MVIYLDLHKHLKNLPEGSVVEEAVETYKAFDNLVAAFDFIDAERGTKSLVERRPAYNTAIVMAMVVPPATWNENGFYVRIVTSDTDSLQAGLFRFHEYMAEAQAEGPPRVHTAKRLIGGTILAVTPRDDRSWIVEVKWLTWPGDLDGSDIPMKWVATRGDWHGIAPTVDEFCWAVPEDQFVMPRVVADEVSRG